MASSPSVCELSTAVPDSELTQDKLARATIALGTVVSASQLFSFDPNWPSGWIGACIVGFGLFILPRYLRENPYGDQFGKQTNQTPPCSEAKLTVAAEDPAAQVNQLFKEALEAKTPDSLIESVDFAARFRRFAPFNAHLIRVQRRGARAVASASEWESVNRTVAPDAIPIMILMPFCPITWVYELGDTFPAINRDEVGDPFAAKSKLDDAAIETALANLNRKCGSHEHFKIEIVGERLGFDYAGSAVSQGRLPIELQSDSVAIHHTDNFKTDAGWTQVTSSKSDKPRTIRLFRVKFNDRLTAAERLVTIAHELGHIFCGHLGSVSPDQRGRAGWPDRSGLGHNVEEMEAEAVAWLVSKRAQIIGGSAAYLKRHVESGDTTEVDPIVVNRAAGLIEKLAGLDYALKPTKN